MTTTTEITKKSNVPVERDFLRNLDCTLQCPRVFQAFGGIVGMTWEWWQFRFWIENKTSFGSCVINHLFFSWHWSIQCWFDPRDCRYCTYRISKRNISERIFRETPARTFERATYLVTLLRDLVCDRWRKKEHDRSFSQTFSTGCSVVKWLSHMRFSPIGSFAAVVIRGLFLEHGGFFLQQQL